MMTTMMIRMIINPIQVTFTGYTGQVSFDRYGVRKNFKLDLMEMVVDNELEKVELTVICFVFTPFACLFFYLII